MPAQAAAISLAASSSAASQLLGDRDEGRQLRERDVRGGEWTPSTKLTARARLQEAARIEPREAVLDGQAAATYRWQQAWRSEAPSRRPSDER